MTDQTTEELTAEMDALLRSLRQCDDRASAVKWMTRAYEAMDGALRTIKNLERRVREESAEAKGLIFYAPKPKLEIVQTIPKFIAHRSISTAHHPRPPSTTVVYPEIFQHPGLKPLPLPWTASDNRKLAAETMRARRIVRMGK